MSEESSNGAIVDKLYQALENKDLEAALACCHRDAVVWHNFDGIAQPIAQVADGWQAMFDQIPKTSVLDVHREAVAGGLVQRHLFVMHGEDGNSIGKPCCIFVRLQDGLIARIDEYLCLTSDLPMPENEKTPGLSVSGQTI